MLKVTSLRDETRRMLQNRPASLEIDQIAEKIGVSVSWLNAFARGEIKNPGVVNIETLRVFLIQKSEEICK